MQLARVSLTGTLTLFSAPTLKEHLLPRTRSRFERMEPSSEDCTIWSSHLTRARMDTINSTRFPRVAYMPKSQQVFQAMGRQSEAHLTLSNPPSVCPTRRASSSVAKPSSFASGMMARKAITNTMVSSTLAK